MHMPPIQTTMARDAEAQRRRNGYLLRGAEVIVLGLLFCTAAFFAFTYFTEAATRTAPTTKAAAAAATQLAAERTAFSSISITAQSAIVVDISTGAVLYERNADTQLPLASLTKVPLVLAVSEVLPSDSVIALLSEIPASSQAGSIPAGSHWRVKDLINYTLAASSNEGAEALGQAADETLRAKYPAAPAGKAAVWRMNDLAKTLGLSHTYFLNASGLDLSASQSGAYGSARDVAVLFAFAASTSPETFAATTQSQINLSSIEGRAVVASNTNEALDAIPGLVMGKTGFTDLANGNLAVVYTAPNGDRLVAVVLNSTWDGRFEDIKTLVKVSEEALPQQQL